MRRPEITAVNHKPGDLVKVTGDPKSDDNVMVDLMYRDFQDKIVTIKEIIPYNKIAYGDSDKDEPFYHIEEDKGSWYWCDGCFTSCDVNVTTKVHDTIREIMI